VITIDEARGVVLRAVRPLPSETVPIADALGRVLTRDVAAAGDVPPFANSAMDGYAVQADDTRGAPVTLTVIETIAAFVTGLSQERMD